MLLHKLPFSWNPECIFVYIGCDSVVIEMDWFVDLWVHGVRSNTIRLSLVWVLQKTLC